MRSAVRHPVVQQADSPPAGVRRSLPRANSSISSVSFCLARRVLGVEAVLCRRAQHRQLLVQRLLVLQGSVQVACDLRLTSFCPFRPRFELFGVRTRCGELIAEPQHTVEERLDLRLELFDS